HGAAAEVQRRAPVTRRRARGERLRVPVHRQRTAGGAADGRLRRGHCLAQRSLVELVEKNLGEWLRQRDRETPQQLEDQVPRTSAVGNLAAPPELLERLRPRPGDQLELGG